MRAIFILLFAANLVFFSYHHFFIGNVKENPPSTIGAEEVHGDGELQLLAEKVGESRSNREAELKAKVEPVNVTHQKSGAELCTMIGPYSQLLQAEYAVERLAALGAAAHISPIEIKEGESYWVYLRPEVSEKEALRRLYELQKKNIESYVITKGELTNGISFGRFADYAEAQSRMIEIKKEGYGADIKMLPKMIQETWVVIDADFVEKIDETVWADLLSKESVLEKRQNFCLGVASQ